MEKMDVVLMKTENDVALYLNGELKEVVGIEFSSDLGQRLVGLGVLSFKTEEVTEKYLDDQFLGEFPHKLSEWLD